MQADGTKILLHLILALIGLVLAIATDQANALKFLEESSWL